MILGTYEKDLHPIIYKWINQPKDLICIGAAEGYYAAGFASNRKCSIIYAYEIEERQRQNLALVCKQNQLDNIRILERCTQNSLNELLSKLNNRVDIMCDIEGGECEILDPCKVPMLKKVKFTYRSA